MRKRFSNKLMATMLIALFVFSITGTFFNLTPTASGNSGYKWLTIKYSPDPMAWNGYEVVPDILPSPLQNSVPVHRSYSLR